MRSAIAAAALALSLSLALFLPLKNRNRCIYTAAASILAGKTSASEPLIFISDIVFKCSDMVYLREYRTNTPVYSRPRPNSRPSKSLISSGVYSINFRQASRGPYIRTVSRPKKLFSPNAVVVVVVVPPRKIGSCYRYKNAPIRVNLGSLLFSVPLAIYLAGPFLRARRRVARARGTSLLFSGPVSLRRTRSTFFFFTADFFSRVYIIPTYIYTRARTSFS